MTLRFFGAPKTSFLVLEVFKDRTNALTFYLDSENNAIFGKFRENISIQDIKTKKIFRRSVKNMIIAADFSAAYTALVPIKAERDNPTEPLSGTELENLLAQAVGKTFNQCRLVAAR